METTLGDMADTIRKKEYEELFPDTSVEEAKNDEEKIKEALFQVHYMVWNKELYELAMHDDRYWIPESEIEDATTEKERERISTFLTGVTVKEEDGETMFAKPDLVDVVRPTPRVRD